LQVLLASAIWRWEVSFTFRPLYSPG